MKAAYVKAPFEIVVKEAPRRALTDTEVRLDIHACGVLSLIHISEPTRR